jgi:hypothetical protein
MNKNARLIAFIEARDVVAYENELGTVTMENRFFNTDEIEYVNVSTFKEARIQLNYYQRQSSCTRSTLQ